MNILIYGSKGWIGNQFIQLMDKHNIPYVCGIARTDNDVDVLKELDNIKPSNVISFIGRTHGTINNKNYSPFRVECSPPKGGSPSTIDYLEQNGKLVENVRDNLFGPLILAELCKRKNIHYTYLGTGCIFKYDEEHPFGKEENGFLEEELPNFTGSSYSIVKGYTDRIMHLYENVLNLRIRMPIVGDPNPRNFITKITTYEKICSIPNSMSVLPELLPYVLKMMENKQVGTINLTNPGLISHNEILEMYREIVDGNFKWNNFSQEEQRLIIESDRSNNYLDTTKLEELFPQILNIKDAVRKCLYEYKNHMDKNVNLLITGGCGFIGSNFINYYFSKTKINKLVNYDAMYYSANELNINENIRTNKKYILVKGNLCDAKLLETTIKQYNITHIIHFAAQSHVQKSFVDAIDFTYDNVMGTHTLLEVCRKYGNIKKIIHVSTDEVYGSSLTTEDELHKTEKSILCPTNPYSASKSAAEMYVQSYIHSFKMPIIITRGNNVYGPNQYPEKLIPLFIKLLKEGKKVTIQGDGSTIRGFLHALDTARAFECILENGVIGEIYNIGCDETVNDIKMEYSVMEIAKLLIKMIKNTDNYDEWINYIEDRPFNDTRYYISNQKLKDLGWNITVDLLTGIQSLI